MTLVTVTSSFLTAAEAAKAGSTVSWSDIEDALASDDVHASALMDPAEKTHYLTATGLATPPPGGTRKLLEVRFKVERNAPSVEIMDLAVYPMIGGAINIGIDYSDGFWPPSDTVKTYTLDAADLAALGINLGSLRHAGFGLAIAAECDASSDTALVDRISAEYDVLTGIEEDEMDVMTHVMAGGLKPLRIDPGTNESCSEAIPAVSSSAAIFENAPAGTVAVSLTVEDQDLIIRWNDPDQMQAATTSAGGGNLYLAGGTYWLPVTRNYLQAARGIQAAATSTGTITYWGKA